MTYQNRRAVRWSQSLGSGPFGPTLCTVNFVIASQGFGFGEFIESVRQVSICEPLISNPMGLRVKLGLPRSARDG
jgi:hypothetical protein